MKTSTKWLLVLAGVATVGVLTVRHYQEQIGLALFERAVNSRVGRDATVSLPDGLHVALCGTGSPLPNADRAGACTVVIAGKHMYVVDAGEGGARNISLMGIPNGKIEGLFLTHFHSDHIDGMGPMMLLRWTGSSAKAPLAVHGPTGVEAVIAGFNAAYSQDNGYRVAHHGEDIVPPSGAGATAMPFAIEGESAVVLEKDGLKVTAFKVDHDPVSPAVGYRFDYKGRSVVVSGDTAKSAVLERVAKGADLLLHEALQPRLVSKMTAALDKKGLGNTAKITRDILDYHASPEEAADSARKAGVGQLVFTHIVPPFPSHFFNPAFQGNAPKRFKGEIVVGEDGMLFSMPAGSKAINRRELM
ncbi:MBL fold metallo-hydrolase [Sphingorhabdus sp.]|uniref:MBL fold metallo-hydrolase n=1 Tax=Sphingorhabdus sp. TaxID=1902408 RepID=UPI0032B79553